MGRIAANELPQPYYPGQTAPMGLVPPAPAALAVSPMAAVPARTRRRPGPLWIGGAAAVLAVALAATALFLARSGSHSPVTTVSTAPPATQSAGSSSVEVTAAVNTAIAGEPVSDDDRRCLTESFNREPALAAAVNDGSYDAGELASVMAGCISAESLAASIVPALAGNGYDLTSAQTSCVTHRIESMTPAEVEELFYVGLTGTADDIASAHLLIWGDCVA